MSAAVPERVLVAGSGSIAARHIANLLAMGVGEIIVLTGRALPPDGPFTDPRVSAVHELPADCPGIAIVANDTSQHVDVARRLVSRGSHVLVEKPLCPLPDAAAEALASEARAGGSVLRVAYNLRFLGVIQRIQALLAENAIGNPLFARIEVGQWLPDWRPRRDYRDGYSAATGRGGGVALDLSHEIDYMRMLFGSPTDWRVISTRTAELEIDGDDVFEGAYRFSEGLLCSVHMDYLERTPRRSMRIVGSEGVIECDIIGGRLDIITSDGVRQFGEPELFDVSRTYVDELESFFAEIVGVPGLLPDVEDGIEVLHLLSEPDGREGHV